MVRYFVNRQHTDKVSWGIVLVDNTMISNLNYDDVFVGSCVCGQHNDK
jgi:hypothetical protein